MKAEKAAPRRAGAQEKHDRILKAAVKIFARHGFHNSKISQIAKEAGVADGTIYLYFKNKDDVLISLFEEKLTEAIDRLKELLDGIDAPEQRFRAFIRNYVLYMDENKELAEVISVELRQSNKFMKEYVPIKFGEFLNLVSNLIRDCKDQGVFRTSVPPGIIKRSIFGALDEMVLYMVLDPHPKYDAEEIADALAEFFLEGLKKHPSSGQ
ncbi:MAG: TetR/AcrR family transcriptional regulator [Deltaproteobacteria bacterium]|nr:TetR/AcrR family transcriptional regulator [bacterium]MCB9489508.1 TetR/AcrR family transcriptional regulator [Deltaproteobacteria bacterium]